MNRGKGVAGVAYTITDLAELVEYQLVDFASDSDAAHSNLVPLIGRLETIAPRPLRREATWAFCDRCGSSLDTELIRPETHHYFDDGDFNCADCGEPGDL